MRFAAIKISLLSISLLWVNGLFDETEARKKKIPKRPKYVGSVKCDGSCHDPYYQAWKNSPHGRTFDILKPGERAEAKTLAGLDPEKNYTTDPNCLRCHTTGYRQRGGFKPVGTKSRKGKDISTFIDPEEPNKEQVGCEMCHSVKGGYQFRMVMKNTKGKFEKGDTEKYGQRWDYKNVCTRCHNHTKNPFNELLDEKYKFDFETMVKTVHPTEKYFNEDNFDQELKHSKDRKKERAQSEITPLRIEDYKIKKGKLYFKKSTMPYDRKKKKFNYKEDVESEPTS